MRLLVIDPSCATTTGHNFSVDALLVQHAAEIGMEIVVFTHATMSRHGSFIPAFSCTAYHGLPSEGVEALRVAHEIARAFFAGLSSIVQPQLRDGDMLLLHTTDAAMLYGFAAWLKTVPNRQNLRIRVMLMLPPGFRQPDARAAALVSRLYAQALEELASLSLDLRFFTENRHLAQLFGSLGANPIEPRWLPSPVADIPDADAPPRAGGRPVVFFAPGEFRVEKGYVFLVNAVVAAAEQAPAAIKGTRFRFMATAMPNEVVEFLGRFPDLFEVLAEREVSNERYWQMLREADFLMCTYDAAEYRVRKSTQFVEAMCLGIPVIYSRGMSVEEDVARDGGTAAIGVTYGDASSLVAGIQLARDRAGEYRSAARSVRARYQERLSVRRYLSRLQAS